MNLFTGLIAKIRSDVEYFGLRVTNRLRREFDAAQLRQARYEARIEQLVAEGRTEAEAWVSVERDILAGATEKWPEAKTQKPNKSSGRRR